MVTKINLLPSEIKQRDKKDRIIFYMFLSLAVLAGIMIGVKLLRDIQINEATAKLENVKTEALGINKSIAQLQIYQARGEELERLNKILASAMGDRMIWSKTLNDVSMITPNDIVITQMTLNKDGITFRAEAPAVINNMAGHKPIAKWLINLKQVPAFKNVWLGSSTKIDDKLTADAAVKFETVAAQSQALKVPPVQGK